MLDQLEKMISYNPGYNMIELIWIAVDYKFPSRKTTPGNSKKGNLFRLTNQDIVSAIKLYNDHHAKKETQ